jgi:hypothetical protein
VLQAEAVQSAKQSLRNDSGASLTFTCKVPFEFSNWDTPLTRAGLLAGGAPVLGANLNDTRT